MARCIQFLQERLVWLILAVYLAAGIWPHFGLLARHTVLVRANVFQHEMVLTLPMGLLAVLLLNAGMATEPTSVLILLGRPMLLLMGLLLNALLPLGFMVLFCRASAFWHNSAEVQSLVVGLAIVAAMPIASSSAAWSQHADGNAALSLGLIILSTLLSPFTTPLILASVGRLSGESPGNLLGMLNGVQTAAFLAVCVVVPSLVGVLLRQAMGEACVRRNKPALKLASALVLVFLCYANAATTLPDVLSQPDWDFLVFSLVMAGALCATGFLGGHCLGRLLRAGEPERRSLMFGLGMNNNGTGMVLAAEALSQVPTALVPVLMYNLVQHLVAGLCLGSRRRLPAA